MRMQFGVLGPVIAEFDGRRLPIRVGKQRTLLVALLLRVGTLVSAESLIDALWGDDPPATARNTLQVHVKRLRETLGSGLLTTEGLGYRLNVAADTIDKVQFDSLLQSARDSRAAGDLESEWDHLTAALDLWRGPVFADIESSVLDRDYGTALEERRLTTMERRFDVGLALCRHSDLVAELFVATAANPFRERLWCQHLLALCGSGRQSEALSEYESIRSRLADELGLDPGAELRGVRDAVLAGESGPQSRHNLIAPAQLPLSPTAFCGRSAEIGQLDRLLTDDSPIAVITGVGGVGKTALAVQWARRTIDHFGDGQLYVDLRGYDGEQAPVAAEHALDGFLRAMGVAGNHMPDDRAERAALYRSLLQHRRMVIVLDNARSSAQVRPLLPGAPGCRVLVTSRDRLDGLVAREGAHQLTLDVLDGQSAVQLLVRLLPADRVESADAAHRLAHCCDGLPLALRIAAARITTNPYHSVGKLADALADLEDRLGVLSLEGPDASIRAALDLSYRALPTAAARQLRLVGCWIGRDISAGCAAALADLDLAEARVQLDLLSQAHLLFRSQNDRYGMHDLVRAYARERSETEDGPSDRTVDARRGVDWLLEGSAEASVLIAQSGLGRPADLNYPSRNPPTFGNPDDALRWLKEEWETAVTAIELCSGLGWHRACWQLTSKIAAFLEFQAHVKAYETVCATGLGSARASGDELGECTMLSFAGNCARYQGKWQIAATRFREALAIAQRLGDGGMSCRIEGALSVVYVLDGQLEKAEQVLVRGIATAKALDETVVAVYHQLVLTNLLAGRDRQRAETLLLELLDSPAAREDKYAVVMIHSQLSQLALQEKELDRAIEHAETAVSTAQLIGEVIEEADGLVVLGECYIDSDPVGAMSYWGQALDIYQRSDNPQAAELRDRISAATVRAR